MPATGPVRRAVMCLPLLSLLPAGRRARADILAAPSPAPVRTLTLGYLPEQTSLAPLILAGAEAAFRREGIALVPVPFRAVRALVLAVYTGQTSAGIIPLFPDPWLRALAMIGGGVREKPGHERHALVATKRAFSGEGLLGPAELAGRRVGDVPGFPVFRVLVSHLARRNGVDPAGITFVPWPSPGALAAALRERANPQIDAGLLLQEQAIRMENRGDVRIIAWAHVEAPVLESGLFTTPERADSRAGSLLAALYRDGAGIYRRLFLALDSTGRRQPARGARQALAFLQERDPFMTLWTLRTLPWIQGEPEQSQGEPEHSRDT